MRGRERDMKRFACSSGQMRDVFFSRLTRLRRRTQPCLRKKRTHRALGRCSEALVEHFTRLEARKLGEPFDFVAHASNARFSASEIKCRNRNRARTREADDKPIVDARFKRLGVE